MQAYQIPLPPAIKLPSELLSIIFQFDFILQTEAAEALKNNFTYWDVQEIMNYSHVCQYWRDVALSTPLLWTHCDVYHKGFSEFCKRSRPLPIHISAWSSWQSSEIFTDAVSTTSGSLLDEAYRIKSLTMLGCPMLISKLISICPTLPILSLLRLWCLDSENPLPVFLSIAPNIRRLDLGQTITNLEPFTNLTHLTLEEIFPEDDMCPMARQIIELLRRSPRLRRLALFHIHMAAPAVTMDPVQLVYLETLNFEDVNTDLLTFIISHLSIPSTAPLISSSRGSFLSNLDIDLDQISISSNPSRLLISVDDPALISSIMPILSSSIDFSLTTNLEITSSDQSQTILPSPSVDDWIMLFAGLPSIDSLFLEIPDAWLDLALRALTPDYSRSLYQCPALRILRIVNNKDDDILPDPGWVLRCLQARSNAGLLPLKLEMNYCAPEIRYIRRLVRDLSSLP